MVRVKRSVHANKKKKTILKATKGYRSQNSKVYKMAKQAWMKAGLHAYKGRKLKKRNYRQLWIARISAGLKQIDSNHKYSRLISSMDYSNVKVNRKVLADMALNHPEAFEKFVKEVYITMPAAETKKATIKKAEKPAAKKEEAPAAEEVAATEEAKA